MTVLVVKIQCILEVTLDGPPVGKVPRVNSVVGALDEFEDCNSDVRTGSFAGRMKPLEVFHLSPGQNSKPIG